MAEETMVPEKEIEEVDETLNEVDDTTPVEELKGKLAFAREKLKEAIETKKRWRERAVDQKTGKLYSELVQQPPSPNQPKESPATDDVKELKADVEALKVEREKRQFGHANNYSPEETDNIFALAAGLNIKPEEAKGKPFVKSAIEALRKEKQAQSGIPSPSHRSTLVDGKPILEHAPKDRAKAMADVARSLKK